MRILVDADACPVNDIIIEVSITYNIDVIMVTDTSHYFNYTLDNVKTIVVDKGRDSVDFALINRVLPGDIVVTQDYGVATMALSKKAFAINQNGKLYNNENIDFMLMNRHISREIRKSGGKLPHIKKRVKENDEKFRLSLIRLIENTMEKAED